MDYDAGFQLKKCTKSSALETRSRGFGFDEGFRFSGFSLWGLRAFLRLKGLVCIAVECLSEIPKAAFAVLREGLSRES